VKHDSPAGKLLRDLINEDDPMYILDVGASGGIEDHWSVFGTKLMADGFDPLINEIVRLNKEAPDNVKYWDAFIDGGSSLRTVVSPHPDDVYLTAFNRTTASEYGRIKNQDYRKEVFNRGEELRYSGNRYSLDEFIEDHARPTPNFLKIDTDGSDFLVLQGAKRTLSDLKCLGVQVECQFHGRPEQVGACSVRLFIPVVCRDRRHRFEHCFGLVEYSERRVHVDFALLNRDAGESMVDAVGE